jgi:F-type H+-transporting ATPase subunit b
MITVDITMVLHIINMVVLMAVLNILLYKPILGMIEKRQGKMDTLRNDVEQFEQNARHRQAEVDKKMREASAKAKKALDGARNEAQAAGSEKLAAIREESDKAKDKQLTEVKAQFEGARKELLDNATGFAQEMAGKILGRSLKA